MVKLTVWRCDICTTEFSTSASLQRVTIGYDVDEESDLHADTLDVCAECKPKLERIVDETKEQLDCRIEGLKIMVNKNGSEE
jgi:DNA-directed RNA polymerase subunit RPC12/RpoP